jgi:DNA-binding transcriptional LysR family regulator
MERGTLKLVRVKNFKLIRKLGLIHRKKRYMSRASKAFLDVVEESLGKKAMQSNQSPNG